MLQGDSNSNYFHKCANGRKRKMQVSMLEVDGLEITNPVTLRDHITDYYKQLFGKVEVANMHLDPNLWPAHQQVSVEDNNMLTRPFTLEEVDLTIKQMKIILLLALMVSL